MRDLLCKVLSLHIQGKVELGFYDQDIWNVEQFWVSGQDQNASNPTTLSRHDDIQDLLCQALSLQIGRQEEMGCYDSDDCGAEQSNVDGELQDSSTPSTPSKPDTKVSKRSTKQPVPAANAELVSPPPRNDKQKFQSESYPNDDQEKGTINDPEEDSNDKAKDRLVHDQDIEAEEEDTPYDAEMIQEEEVSVGDMMEVLGEREGVSSVSR
jgi:hypothetical protein